jgi:hypothetical protein
MKDEIELTSCRSTNHNPRPLESYLRHTVKVGFEAVRIGRLITSRRAERV